MSAINISDLKSRARIAEVWGALGGPRLRGSRGQAWWRGGTHLSVALYPQTNTWHDFAGNTGGDVIALVETVMQCDFKVAIAWLADFTGMSPVGDIGHRHRDADTDWPTDLKWATWWAITAEMLAEWALEELPPWHPERYGLTRLLRAIRLGDASLVAEYRDWRKHNPQLAAAMTRVGRLHDADLQRRMALWVVGGMR